MVVLTRNAGLINDEIGIVANMDDAGLSPTAAAAYPATTNSADEPALNVVPRWFPILPPTKPWPVRPSYEPLEPTTTITGAAQAQAPTPTTAELETRMHFPTSPGNTWPVNTANDASPNTAEYTTFAVKPRATDAALSAHRGSDNSGDTNDATDSISAGEAEPAGRRPVPFPGHPDNLWKVRARDDIPTNTATDTVLAVKPRATDAAANARGGSDNSENQNDDTNTNPDHDVEPDAPLNQLPRPFPGSPIWLGDA